MEFRIVKFSDGKHGTQVLVWSFLGFSKWTFLSEKAELARNASEVKRCASYPEAETLAKEFFEKTGNPGYERVGTLTLGGRE